jgi:hypothetical protein
MSLDSVSRRQRRGPRGALAYGPAAALALACPAAARAAPGGGTDPKPVHVLHLASTGRDSYDALRLTKDLEQRFVTSSDARLVNSGKSLLELLDRAKCGRSFIKRTLDRNAGLDESAERDLEGPCLAKVAASLGEAGAPADRFVWGWLGREGGQSFAMVHLWQKGQPDRRVRLAYAPDQSARAAERIYLKLWHAGEVGDARVAAAATEGDLWVDDQDKGAFAAGTELTLKAGEHVFELRQRGKVAARAKAAVPAGGATDVRLEPVTEPAAPVAAATPAPPPPEQPAEPLPPTSTVETARRRSVLPWVAFGAGAAAFVTSGVFFALRQGKESDLEGACFDGCPPGQQNNIDASNRYGALSLVFGGVGLAAAGVGVWALLQQTHDTSSTAAGPARAPRSRTASAAGRVAPLGAAAPFGPAARGVPARETGGSPWLAPVVRYDVRPLPGGAAATLSASF